MIDALDSPSRLRQTAPLIRVPIQYVLGQDEHLWNATPECLEAYRLLHSAAPFVDARVMPNVGHNIDMHHLGPALHLRQLSFAAECAAWANQSYSDCYNSARWNLRTPSGTVRRSRRRASAIAVRNSAR